MGKWRDAATDKQREDADLLGFDIDKQFELRLNSMAMDAANLRVTKSLSSIAKLPANAQNDVITAASDVIRGLLTPEMLQSAFDAGLAAVSESDKAIFLKG